MVYFYQLVSGQLSLDNFHIRLRLVELFCQVRGQILVRLTCDRWCRYAYLQTAVMNVSNSIPFGPGLDVNIDQEILS